MSRSSAVGGQEDGVKALENRAGTEPHGVTTWRLLGEEEAGKVRKNLGGGLSWRAGWGEADQQQCRATRC